MLTGDNQTAEGAVLGRIGNMGLTVVRVDGLNRPALAPAHEPKPGHLAVAVGRTWSGGVMATLAPIAVVGGPLRTGRTGSIDRVIRIQQAPHGALNGGALIDADGQRARHHHLAGHSRHHRGDSGIARVGGRSEDASRRRREAGIPRRQLDAGAAARAAARRTIAERRPADQPGRGQQSRRTAAACWSAT